MSDAQPNGRTCRECGEWKSAERFYRYKNGRLHTNCYPCHSAISSRWFAANKRVRRNTELKRKYGIDIAEYDRLLEGQGGCCAICRKEETAKYGETTFSLAVDHCHKTGRVRGLLCARCNRVLGQIEDLGLERVGEYLDASKPSSDSAALSL